MLLTTLSTNEEVHLYKKSLVLLFNGKRKVLSTGPHNGGYHENLTAVFNNDGTVGAGMASPLLASSYEEHMVIRSEQLGLDPAKTTGISTAAQMENVSIKTASHKDITVTAIVTGGVETNGGRVGDPAAWDELSNESIERAGHGTINIILHINVNLTEGALTRALVTCTEAKTAALQELMAPSRYSMGLATGSGTDSTIVIANAESDITLANAGKHCKLGELIGITVKAAVTEALYLQTGLSAMSQHDVLKRVSRFGITEDLLFDSYSQLVENGLIRPHFSSRVEELLRQDSLVTLASLYVHLIDQMIWGLLSPNEVLVAAGHLLTLMAMPQISQHKLNDSSSVTDYLHVLLGALIDGLLVLLCATETEDQDTIETTQNTLGAAEAVDIFADQASSEPAQTSESEPIDD